MAIGSLTAPYHGDTNPSFAVKLDEGVFICYACDVRGPFVELYAKMKNVSKEEARRIISPPPLSKHSTGNTL